MNSTKFRSSIIVFVIVALVVTLDQIYDGWRKALALTSIRDSANQGVRIEVRDNDKENDPILNSTEIMAENIETELKGSETSINQGTEYQMPHVLQKTTDTTQQQIREAVRPTLGQTSVSITSKSSKEENTRIDIKDRICVIHVGPHKTGSTSLQSFLLLNRESQTALREDNYRVPLFTHGPLISNKPKNHAALAYCLRPQDNRCPTEAVRNGNMNDYQSFVDRAAMSGSNIILSSEPYDFDDLNIALLMKPLVPHYKVHVVVYYRRLYDWLHSLHNQYTKGGVNTHTFVEWLTHDWLEVSQYRFTPAIYERYKNYPGTYKVSVVNMHEDPDNFNTNVRFFCDHVDNAPHACELAKSTKVTQANGSVDINTLNWIFLKNRIPLRHSIKLSDKDVRWKKIQKKFNSMTDIPKVCLSPEMKDELLRASLESEIVVTPEWWHNSAEGLVALKSDFESKIDSALCSIDIEAILTSDEWQTFLTQVKVGTTG